MNCLREEPRAVPYLAANGPIYIVNYLSYRAVSYGPEPSGPRVLPDWFFSISLGPVPWLPDLVPAGGLMS